MRNRYYSSKMISQPLPYPNFPKHLIAIDCIIFGFDGLDLKGLFIKRQLEPEKGNWSLMGGFVHENESVDQAAERVLYELTGLSNVFMEQVKCYGNLDRDAHARVVSIAYYAVINIHSYSEVERDAHHAIWVDLQNLPPLIFDHAIMVADAKEKLKENVAYHPIGFALLPPKFTLKQLRALYEAIYEVPIDKRNFTRKIFSMNILKKLEEKEKKNSRKGSFYFVFDEEKYHQLLVQGIKFM